MSNLPPVEPPDLRNRHQQNQGNPNYPPQNSSNYPPPGSNYPPPGQPKPQQPRPQQPQQPQQPSYPPPNQGNYPPPGYNPPPQQPQQPQQPRPQPQQPSYPPPGQQPPAYTPQEPEWDDPVPPARRGGQRGSSAPSTSHSSDFEDANVPNLRRGRSYDDYDTPGQPPHRRGSGGLFSEGQFEALVWGVVVIMLGFAVILALTSNPDWLTSYWPLFSGILLFGSIVFQKGLMGWRVSPLTQLLATLLIAYSITQLIAGTNEDNGFLTLVAYYLGTCIITAGIMILSGIFRRS